MVSMKRWDGKIGKKREREEAERPQPISQVRKKRRGGVSEVEEIKVLECRIANGAPPAGSNPLAATVSEEEAKVEEKLRPYAGAKLFSQLPLCDRTRRGLADAKFTHLTAIQRAAIPHALCGRDVLGAAKTGSGKTLAFLVPVIEKLFRLRWGTLDGVGAIIISPTRELAVQIFDELKKVGKHHSLSGGLLIGGRKGVDTEKGHVSSLNILVCTPGRLLQHMDETPNFDCSQLQVLVLDEADRILDMGFAKTLNAIVAQLPKQRQTFLFSATQTRSVQDLARLSLQDPEYLSVHAESTTATPARLQQTAMIVPLDEKLDMLWSFVKSHLRSKMLVFLSSCKQVKFVSEAFKKLRPGVPVKCLHGRMKQMQRSLVFFDFCESRHSLLFATDVAARGLDFPAVDWVVQVDCPEDVATYIHRVGRTARYTASGRSLLFLTPSEQKMLTAFEASKIPVKVIKANMNKVQQVSPALAALLSKSPELKYLAQRAFVTYLRSLHLRPDKEMFDVANLPLAEFAASMGLPSTPRIRFLKNASAKAAKNAPRDSNHVVEGSDNSEADEEHEEPDTMDEHADVGNGEQTEADVASLSAWLPDRDVNAKKKASKLNRLFRRKNADVLSATYEKMRAHEPADEDEFMFRARKDNDGTMQGQAGPGDPSGGGVAVKSSGVKVSKKKKVLKIDLSKAGGQRLVFDEDGNAITPFEALALQKEQKEEQEELARAAEERNRSLKEEMKRRDKEDRLLEKQRLREKRQKKRQKLLKKSSEAEAEGDAVRLGADTGHSEDDIDAGSRSPASSDAGSDRDDDTGKGHAAHLSLAEQEALALKLLRSRH